jgi:type I restriction enzyme M protein
MLDNITKKRIDDLRNILVGKIPSPQSQVEQITTALIYKFMHDMDQEAIEMGGVSSFFVNDYEKYSWKNLFDPKLGGAEKVQLYSDAIEHMYTNPNAPQLFREIFKNSFLPFKDPVTLNMFLKEINEFQYSHSEKLGDAFEYLLSFMGSQGDAGQFRTPRHIIDFIIEIINPTKNESILDPACGTAGFLISSYKHILNKNTSKKLGDQLTASDRKRMGENLVGYDISPDMTRLSLVNMYLHQFTSPQIYEYDTLSSEDRWNEYYDVILANPPFFSPTGGIQPHSRFAVQSTRSEVLFVDYIMEHLKPTGRAGVVVPEGIIFQVGSAYKILRNKLVEDCLIGVISLPAGVFQPYSGVKTSILILDKNKNKKSDFIFFAKVENDGFSLSAQRAEIEGSDFQSILDAIRSLDKSKLTIINKLDIKNDSNHSLTLNAYDQTNKISSSHPIVKIGDVFKTSSGGTPTSTNELYYKNGKIPWVRSGEVDGQFITDTEIKITKSGLENSSAKLFPPNSVLVAMYGATAGKVGMLEIEASTNQAVCAIFPNEKCMPKYLYYVLRSQEKKLVELSVGGAQPNISQTIIKNFSIPLPSLDIQAEIIHEIENHEKNIANSKKLITREYENISNLVNKLWN